MHALEMEPEEIESLVGSEIGSGTSSRIGGLSRKQQQSKQKQKDNNILSSFIMRPGLLTKVGVVALLATVTIIYTTMKGESQVFDGELEDVAVDNEMKENFIPDDNATSNHNKNVSRKMIYYENGEYIYSKISSMAPLVDHPFPDDKTKEKMAEKFGHWHFWDGEELNRPAADYMAEYPYRDIPGDDFPEDAWQADAVFVNHYLNDADQLIARTMEAIFTEYGHGKPLPAEGLANRMKMFHWDKINLVTETQPPEKFRKKGNRGNGGWTTSRSFDGLVLRLTHAMMTSDTFTVVMGGHSAAAAQGNHFRQSYMMQFHKIMYPVFARLGVKLITRNFGMGGMGTVHNGIGSGSIYGDEIDLILWDSGMTEGSLDHHIDLFYRQALLAGNRIPIIWGGRFDLLKMLHEEADVDIGEWGLATDGIIEVEDAEQAKTIPWAARYMKCTPDAEALCKEEPRFCSTCWIDREDGVKPTERQLDKPKGQVKWHPGWRDHQLTGRNLAMAVLAGLQAAVNQWNEGVMGGPPLDDEFWHVKDYYENIRKKVLALDASKGACNNIEEQLPTRMCNIPMKARTQYTPRANFAESSLTSIIKPTPDGYVPMNEKVELYEGPDAHNVCLDIPEDALDVFNVVVGRRRVEEKDIFGAINEKPTVSAARETEPTQGRSNRDLADEIVPGKGWEVWGEPYGTCDGTYNENCGRSGDNECVLYGHHDGRGAIIGNEYSGWLVFTLEDLKEGIIVLKLHTWHTEDESIKTKGWTSVNNEPEKRKLRDGQRSFHDGMAGKEPPLDTTVDEHDERMLMRSYDTPELPEGFKFEYAIDGQITSLNKEQFLEKKKQVQRVVETITLLDDPSFTSAAKNVEVAIRLVGCGRVITFGITHVYWA